MQVIEFIESKKVCSHRKGSEDGKIIAPSRRPCPENSKYSWRVEQKFGVIDPEVRQVTRPLTSESDPGVTRASVKINGR
ncbi:hypothetical protein TNCV_3431331 [Trichonephila clavipes]|nr:hypothetical protein TNCV_3431331 [Trichonephila clavipes]